MRTLIGIAIVVLSLGCAFLLYGLSTRKKYVNLEERLRGWS